MSFFARRRRLPAVVCVFCLLLPGCGEIPDLKPFAQSTAEMSVVTRQGFQQTKSVLDRFAADPALPADLQNQLGEELKTLTANLQAMDNALIALAAYADSLATLAEAGRNSQATVGAFYDSLTALFETVRVIPFKETLRPVVQAIGGKIIALRTERDLRKFVNAAAEIVTGENSISFLLRENVQDLGVIHARVSRSFATELRSEHDEIIKYYDQIVFDDRRVQRILGLILEYRAVPAQLEERAERARARLQRRINALQANPDPQCTGACLAEQIGKLRDETEARIKTEILGTERAVRRDTFAALAKNHAEFRPLAAELTALDPNWSNLSQDQARENLINPLLDAQELLLLNRARALQSDLARIRPEYQAINGRLDQIELNARVGREHYLRSQQALAGWESAHRDLQLTLNEERRGIRLKQLVIAVLDLNGNLRKADQGQGEN